MPHNGSNAIDIVTDIHVALRGFDRRVLGALEPCSLVPAVSNAGTASNIRPASAEIWYAARNFLPEDRRDQFAQAIRERVAQVVAGYKDATFEYQYVKGHPMLFNTESHVVSVSRLLRDAGVMVEGITPQLGGDDFAYYTQKCPGAYFLLGANKEGAGDHHTPTFDVDESTFKFGILYWLLLATN
jgi:amidohydrolase